MKTVCVCVNKNVKNPYGFKTGNFLSCSHFHVLSEIFLFMERGLSLLAEEKVIVFNKIKPCKTVNILPHVMHIHT